MKKINFLLVVFLFLSIFIGTSAQSDYLAKVNSFRTEREREFRTPETSPFATYNILKKFKGLLWYEINPDYRISAKFTATPDEPQFQMTTFGNKQTIPHRKYGIAAFSFNGQDYSLNVYQNEFSERSKFIYVPFQDVTNADETYQGGRYMNVEYPSEGKIVLDFNYAYDPECAYNAAYVCPAPPNENRLNTRIEAGERLVVIAKPKAKEATAKVEKPKVEKVKEEKPKVEKVETPKSEKAKVEKVETPKPEKPKVEKPAKVEKMKEEKVVATKPEEPKTSIPNGHFAKFNGQNVFYQDSGKGTDAIIFVHGWACNSEFWKDSYNAFPDKRVIAIDLIGHGKSDKPQTNYSMEYFAKSIDAVMKDAKIKHAVLVGHSMGTPVIRQFYRLFPEKTLALIIVDGTLRPYASNAEMMKFIEPLRSNYETAASAMIDNLIAPIKDESRKAAIKTSMLSTPNYVAISAMEGMADDAIWGTDQIKVPVLAILAESSFGKQADVEQFDRSIAPNLDFRMWKDVSHFLMMDNAPYFNQVLKYFFNKNKLFAK